MNVEKLFEDKNLTIHATVLGLLSNNVYMLQSDGNTTIVDPSCRPNEILDMAGDRKINNILITHYHFDHIGAACVLKEETGAATIASAIDAPFISGQEEIPMAHRRTQPCDIDKTVAEGDEITLGNITWKVIETPGHTMGSICFYTTDTKLPILIAGDTLFRESYGRVDFPDSSPQAMLQSLKRLSQLPSETIVLPGHGQLTSVMHEKNFALQ